MEEAPKVDINYSNDSDCTVSSSQGLRVPVRSDNNAADNQSGRQFAIAVVAAIVAEENPTILAHQVKRLMLTEWSGVHVGFFHHIAERLL